MDVTARLSLVLYSYVALTMQPAHSQADKSNSGNEYNNCQKYSPKITFEHASITGFITTYGGSDNEEYVFPYGTSLKVRCKSDDADASRLAMTKQEILLPSKIESKSITYSTGKLDLQKNTEYSCTVKETVCKSSPRFISVTPALDVISSDGRFSELTTTNFTVEYGNSMSVFCSGPLASGLVLTKDGKQLPTEHVNNSTIEWSESTPDLQISTYFCTDAENGYNRSVLIKVVPHIYGPGIVFSNGIYEYELTYEDNSAVFCSGPRAVKFIRLENDSEDIFTEQLNKTTAKLFKTSSKLGKSIYACVDSDFSDYTSTVHITVLPRMVLTSPNFGSSSCSERGECVAKYGDPLEIICTGQDAAELTLGPYSAKKEKKGALQIVNATTIKWFTSELDYTIAYVCSTEEVSLSIYISVFPVTEAVDFHCISHYFQYLNCSWSLPASPFVYANNFTLFYVDNGIPELIYGEHLFRPYQYFFTNSRSCVWHITDRPGYPDDVATLSFIMQSCNKLGCFNQTFHIDHLSIVKLYPPTLEILYGEDSRHAVVKWYSIEIKLAGESFNNVNGAFYYRIEYQYPGMEPLEANSSLATCNNFDCFIKLTLPCPEQSYEVRVYHKIKRAAGEEYWSDPISGSVYIEAENNLMDIDDPKCIKGPRKTKDVMIYFVQNLRKEVKLFKPQMKKLVSSLQKKLKEIQLLRSQFKNDL